MFFAICWYKGYRDGSDMDFALEELLAETSNGNRKLYKVKYQIEIAERERERHWCELISVGGKGLGLALKEKHYFCRQEKRR